MRKQLLLTVAVFSAALLGCEADDSLPSRPRTANPFTADQHAQDAAEHRSLETPSRNVPTGGSGDAPGQLNEGPAVPGASVVTADAGADMQQAGNKFMNSVESNGRTAAASGQKAWEMMWNSPHPVDSYPNDPFVGPLPHLPANPGTVPMAGYTVVPGTEWNVDNSWGQGLQLTDYPHRAWPETQANYQIANTKFNPIYYFSIQQYLPVRQNDGSYTSDIRSSFYEVPWFFLNTAALPVLMVLEPPLVQKTAYEGGVDPNFHGYVPTGPVVPTPSAGEMKWLFMDINGEKK